MLLLLMPLLMLLLMMLLMCSCTGSSHIVRMPYILALALAAAENVLHGKQPHRAPLASTIVHRHAARVHITPCSRVIGHIQWFDICSVI